MAESKYEKWKAWYEVPERYKDVLEMLKEAGQIDETDLPTDEEEAAIQIMYDFMSGRDSSRLLLLIANYSRKLTVEYYLPDNEKPSKRYKKHGRFYRWTDWNITKDFPKTGK